MVTKDFPSPASPSAAPAPPASRGNTQVSPEAPHTPPRGNDSQFSLSDGLISSTLSWLISLGFSSRLSRCRSAEFIFSNVQSTSWLKFSSFNWTVVAASTTPGPCQYCVLFGDPQIEVNYLLNNYSSSWHEASAGQAWILWPVWKLSKARRLSSR